VRFALLGPLTVVDDAGAELEMPAPRLRILLAALLLRANAPVAAEALVEAVWNAAAPPGAASTLRSYIRRLRIALGPAGTGRIEARNPGYLIRLEPAELDVLEFEALCRGAGAALRERAWARAGEAAGRAVDLWRGAPLLDVASQVLHDGCVLRLESLRLQALEDRAEAELNLGRHAALVPQLRELAGTYPLRERFWAQLMLALYRAGRQAEAIEAYQTAQGVLAEELGVDPGLELRHLYERVLAGDGALLSREQRAPAAADVVVAPRQLPSAAQYFTGRQAELNALIDWCGAAEAWGGTVVISAIDGMAGIGKTALALNAAHELAGKFPGGQLFIDLHGYTKGSAPRGPGQALEFLLRALGVGAAQIPEETEARAALYRQRLADTRTLVVLDNALDEAQVRPLLPGHPECLVLVTSRRRLKGLDDARSLSLDLLPAPDAIALLAAVAGRDRVAVGDRQAGEVAVLCGYLPLALRIAGALLRHRPAWTLEHLAGVLRERHDRLTALSDGERDLAGVFDLSYTCLGDQHRRLFRRLGLIPGSDLDAYAAAALHDCAPQAAAALLEDLVDHNLLIEHAPGRYRLHDLIRAHARTLTDLDGVADNSASLDRLLHYYAHTAQSASVPVAARYPRPQPSGPIPAHAPAMTDPAAARTWLRTERDNLEAAHAHARAHALHEHTIALAAGLAEILCTDGPFAPAIALHHAAAETAAYLGRLDARAAALTDLGHVRRLAGDLPGAEQALAGAVEICLAIGHHQGEALALTSLGRVRMLTGNLLGAEHAATRALEIYRTTGHRQGEAIAVTELGHVRLLTGNLPGAEQAAIRALEIYRATGHRQGEANTLIGVGRVRRIAGDLLGAEEAATRALEIYRAIDRPQGEAWALGELGSVRLSAGDLPGAEDALTQALEIYRATGHAAGEATTQTDLGRVRMSTGDVPGAEDALTRALKIYRTLGHRTGEAWALNHYAAAVAMDDLPRALTLYRQALAMNRELNKPDDEALSLEGIGECHLSTGKTDTGISLLRQALEIYQRLGMAPDAARIQARLAE
jgi:DNA-binding SARP family transcriptional activator